jgi:hypothetical protein
MEELLIELTEFQRMRKKEKVLYLLLGILIAVIGFSLIVSRILGGSAAKEFLLPGFMILSGINVILYSSEVFFRFFRRYILVDAKGIQYTLAFYNPARRIFWKDMKKVEIRLLRIMITQTSGKTNQIKLGEIPYHDVRNLKTRILSISRRKRIPCKDLTDKDFNRQ